MGAQPVPTSPQPVCCLDFQGWFRTGDGVPQTIRTDNGLPFAAIGPGALTPLPVWWVKLGIGPERIATRHPEQNGRLERFHRALKT